MSRVIQTVATHHSPETLALRVGGYAGVVLLRTSLFDQSSARYSFVTCAPFLTFRSFGSRCEIRTAEESQLQFGNPWHLLDRLMDRYELLDEPDLPFPLGGCFGFWGYDLKNFVEPKLSSRALDDLELPDCQVGFYDSLVVFDHHLKTCAIISTGLLSDGSRNEERAVTQNRFWLNVLSEEPVEATHPIRHFEPETLSTNVCKESFIASVLKAKDYIHAGDIYQVNLSQRVTARCGMDGWELFSLLQDISPSPFGAYLNCGDFELASSSPESFLRMSGSHIQTRPIKGTRPRSPDATRDAQFTYDLQTSPKEISELVMITDLLRNDLGKVCSYGSVTVPELLKLERYPQVQHLVSTVEGSLAPGITHFQAFASCFPGGSITGAPKFRAMEIIDELEPIRRGPYTGALGYIGFNRESHLSIIIRTAICQGGTAYFNVGAGIVADSVPEAEYEETLAKAAGFLRAINPAGIKNPIIIPDYK
jgi:para-aminobenzoate synthetase component 1